MKQIALFSIVALANVPVFAFAGKTPLSSPKGSAKSSPQVSPRSSTGATTETESTHSGRSEENTEVNPAASPSPEPTPAPVSSASSSSSFNSLGRFSSSSSSAAAPAATESPRSAAPEVATAPTIADTEAETITTLKAVIEAFDLKNTSIAVITPRLLLSGVGPAENQDLLTTLGVTHIVNLTGYKKDSTEFRYPPKFLSNFKYLHIPIADESDKATKDKFLWTAIRPAHKFIFDALAENSNNRILVHCEAGISRSSTVMISVLMKLNGISLKSAYDQVLTAKPNIGPNHAFFDVLTRFEAGLKAKEVIPAGTVVPSYPLLDYLVDQMMSGPAAMFSRDQVVAALIRTRKTEGSSSSSSSSPSNFTYDPNAALMILFNSLN